MIVIPSERSESRDLEGITMKKTKETEEIKASVKKDIEDQETFEEKYEKLERIVEKMEDPETTLGESFDSYKEGMEIVKSLYGMIDYMEKEVIELSGDAMGEDDEEEDEE